jgi:N-acetylglucosamine-6-sulfatase
VLSHSRSKLLNEFLIVQRSQDPPISYDGQYSTDIVADKGLAFLNDAITADKPFFLTFAPTAPHSRVDSSGGQHPPVPAVRHAGLFNDTIIPRTANFNPDVPSGASWIATLPQQNQTNVDYNDDWYRNRLRTLQAVDEMIPTLFDRLTEAGILENTYIFYSTDNGYSIGQHRRQPGKQCAYQEDINIPLIVRGPGVPAGFSSDFVTSHLDLAPTFLALAGVTGENALQRYKLDGSAIPLDTDTLVARPQEGTQEHVNAEMWGIIISEGMYGMVEYFNHTYKALRVIGEEYNVMYNVWCVGDHELYDLGADPYEMDNLFLQDKSTEITLSGTAGDGTITTTIGTLLNRLDALLLVQKSCAGDDCRQPWEALHTAGDVQSLKDALATQYDDFYINLPKVAWDQCDRGYIKEMEGIMWDEQLGFDQRFMQHEVWTGL